jgi:hypothetical protein
VGVAHYPGVGCKSKENKITIKEAKRMGVTPARETPCSFCSGIFMHKQGLGGRGAAADGVDAHSVVHHGVLWARVAVG